jgi:hypothetical protein
MTETEIRDVLERATSDVTTPPDLLDRVRAGGRRRMIRRRTVLAAGAATVAAGSGAGLLGGLRGHDPGPAFARLTLPTRGDLAGDTAYLRRAAARWRDHVGGDSMIGEPHVSWALSTPAGPVAVVASRVMSGPGQPAGWTGFVDGDRVTGVEALRPGVPNTEVLLAGRDRDVLVAVDGGRHLEYSPDFGYDEQGRVRRTFRPVILDADGVLVARVPSQISRLRTALRHDHAPVRPAGLDGIASGPVPLLTRLLPGRERAWGDDATLAPDVLDRWELRNRAAYLDEYGVHHGTPGTHWCVRGGTLDGHRFLVQTLVLDSDVRIFRTVSATTTGTPVYLGLLNSSETVPVIRVRLPNSLGVVVAAEGARLRYRGGSADWLVVAGDAALLPDAARELEVTQRRGRTFRVPLS